MTAKLDIRVDARGLGVVKLDGREIQNVLRGISLHTNAGELTQADLILTNVEVTVQGEAETFLVGCLKCGRQHPCPTEQKP
jgi:hypothetical protein